MLIVCVLAPTGKRGLVTRAGTEDNSSLLEIWGHGRLLKQLNVPKSLHGSIYNDSWFGTGGGAWSPDESRFVYVAEVKTCKLMRTEPCLPCSSWR